MEEIGAIIAMLGLIGILIILGIGAFNIGIVLGWMYIFVVMIFIGGTMADWDNEPWWY